MVLPLATVATGQVTFMGIAGKATDSAGGSQTVINDVILHPGNSVMVLVALPASAAGVAVFDDAPGGSNFYSSDLDTQDDGGTRVAVFSAHAISWFTDPGRGRHIRVNHPPLVAGACCGALALEFGGVRGPDWPDRFAYATGTSLMPDTSAVPQPGTAGELLLGAFAISGMDLSFTVSAPLADAGSAGCSSRLIAGAFWVTAGAGREGADGVVRYSAGLTTPSWAAAAVRYLPRSPPTPAGP